MQDFPQKKDRNVRLTHALLLRVVKWCVPLVAFATCAGSSWRAEAQVVVNASGVREEVHVVSLRTKRDMGVVKQGYDYSCGAAALATLLTYGLNDMVGEDDLLRALLQPLSSDQLAALQKKGLSLLDLQKLAQNRGHKAQGFRIHLNQLVKLAYPVIVFIRPHGYRHFAVLKGVRGDRVYLADPSLGNVRMPLYRFVNMWADGSGEGVIFAVERIDGAWPDRFALRLTGGGGPPLEVLSAAKMQEAGNLVLPLSQQRGSN
jgi:predicted double-glycine peptidase